MPSQRRTEPVGDGTTTVKLLMAVAVSLAVSVNAWRSDKTSPTPSDVVVVSLEKLSEAEPRRVGGVIERPYAAENNSRSVVPAIIPE